MKLGFLTIILLLWTICVVTLLNTISVREVFIDLEGNVIPETIAISEIQHTACEIRMWTLTYIIRGNVVRDGKTIKEWLQEQWAYLEKDVRKHFECDCHFGSEEKRVDEKVVDLSQELISISAEIIDLKDKGSENYELFEIVRKRFGSHIFYPLRRLLDEHTAAHLEKLSVAGINIHSRCNTNIRYIIIMGILSTLLALLMGLIVDRFFVKYLTLHRETEEEIRKLKVFNEDIIQNMLEGVFVEDINGNFTFVNPAAAALLGYSSEELVGQHWTLTVPSDQQPIVQSANELRRQGISSRYELQLLRKDGSRVPILVSATPRFEDGCFAGVLSVSTDISERKQVEKELKHYADELMQSNKEIKQFAYIVSHDLRTPLVNLKGFSGELRSSLEEIDSAIKEALPHMDEKKQQVVTTALRQDVPEALDFIESSVTRMDNFINAILKLSRFGHRQLTFETVEMDTLVQTVLKSLAHQIEEYKIKVTVSALPEIVADRISMEQIMGNLLDNAVLYLDPNRPGKIEVSAVCTNNETIFKISDNGHGIRKADMNKVFAPFRRAGQEDVIGEGMGLAYVKTLVHRHEGRIWCESEYGVGTTFTFTISNLLKKGGSLCPRHMK